MYIDPNPYPTDIVLGFPIWTFFVFVIGACFGSFLNVCIWRMPRGESIVSPPSSCPKCGHSLGWYENFPIIGWLLLRGKCKSCKQPISIQYLLMEILVGLMFIAVWFKVTYYHEYLTALIPYLIASSFVVTTFFIDLKHYIIPNETTYFTMIAGLICAAFLPELWPANVWWRSLLQSAICLVVAYAFLAGFAFVGKKLLKQDALGGGDVKYVAAISALLGLKCAFFTLLIGSVLGTIVGCIIMARKKEGVKTVIAFGPYLAVGTYIWILVGDTLTQWYFNITH